METTRDKILKVIRALPNVDPTQIDAVFSGQHGKSMGLVKLLLQQNIVSEQELMVLLVRELHIPSIDLSKYRFDERLKAAVPEKIARQYSVVPISSLGDTLTVAVADPLNVFIADDLRNITGKNVDMVIATESQIKTAIDQYYTSASASIAQVTENLESEGMEIIAGEEKPPDINTDGADEAPVIRMANLVIKEAIRQRASDIHMEPTADGMRVRFRIDGILQDILNIPKERQNAVAVRIKIMARLDITAQQVPQDGRFKMRIGSQEIDFRVSLLPTTFGQKVVMRVLDKGNLSIGLGKLGFSKAAVKVLDEGIRKPFGMILVTGPTGSGKSTTLYSIINQLNTPERNIITIEDPVEYLVDGLTQIEAKHDIGLNFAAGLRAILRQSPDVVMVGEIRDSETADIAIKASLTGQLVLSTLHTNNAAGAATRLIDMGLEPFLVASSLVLVCAQRLCRRICPHCKKPIEVPPEALKRIGNRIKPGTVFYEGKGCDHCRHTGYLGRLGVTEILQIDDRVRDLLITGKSADDISEYAQKHQGMRLLFDDVIDKMSQGETSLAEVFRITSDED
jgi:type IV pilus assembly protein PilB